MRLLAIETATLEVGASVIGADGPIAVSRSRPGRRHAESLHPAIADVLDRARLRIMDLDAVAVDIGPGLFTGLRVGVATAKGIAFATGTPLVPVRSTAVLRHDAEVSGSRAQATVVPVVDMRRGEVAWELEGCEPSLGGPEDLMASLSTVSGEVFLVGDGALRWREEISGGARFRFGDQELAAPSVVGVGAVAAPLLAAGAEVQAMVSTSRLVAPRAMRTPISRVRWVTE